jgi:hypothetical protein
MNSSLSSSNETIDTSCPYKMATKIIYNYAMPAVSAIGIVFNLFRFLKIFGLINSKCSIV